MPTKEKSKLPPFDEKCKVCNRPIPKPMEFCSSECRREYRKINPSFFDDSISVRNEKKTKTSELGTGLGDLENFCSKPCLKGKPCLPDSDKCPLRKTISSRTEKKT